MRLTVILVAPIVSVVALGCSSAPPSSTTATGAMRDNAANDRLANAVDLQPVVSESDTNWIVKRVGGDMNAQTTGSSGDYRFGRSRVDTELPEGYPAPTPPGAIEIKKYPAARRAEVTGRMNADIGMNLGFWPLFQHIQRNDIAMTSPVEMDYRDWPDTRGENPDAWTMSFLYRTPEMGFTGSDGRVQIVDTQPLIVLSLGMTGQYRLSTVRSGLARLNAWLAAQTDWERIPDSSPRALYYNDPGVPDRYKWMEVQLPVCRTTR